MKVRLTIRRVHHADNPQRLVWEWFFEDCNGFVAGGYCATRKDAENDASIWRRNHTAA